jgi:EAL domain-containing protein (putative c-di-GMP-specific phosphodiesterase class I)
VAKEILTRVSALGAQISIDDFGTGHSSLAYIKQLPIHEIKLDKSFIKNLSLDMKDVQIVQSTIELGHSLGLRVLAEGVEDEETYKQLTRLNSDLAQGFYIGCPVPAQELADWLMGFSRHQRSRSLAKRA